MASTFFLVEKLGFCCCCITDINHSKRCHEYALRRCFPVGAVALPIPVASLPSCTVQFRHRSAFDLSRTGLGLYAYKTV